MTKIRWRISWRTAVASTLAILAASCASSPPPAPAEKAASPTPAEAAAPAPAPLEGEWGIQIKLMEHPVDGTLRFTRQGRALLGTFTDDIGNQSELQSLHVDGGKISWQMDAREGTLAAKGTIQGTIMSGKMKLHRARDESETGFGVSGGRTGGGRRPGEPDSYAWTAIKRAETTTPPTAPPPPPQ